MASSSFKALLISERFMDNTSVYFFLLYHALRELQEKLAGGVEISEKVC
jgi:hypothetical protein